MEQINGYYKVTWNDKVAVCHIYAPKEGGVPVTYKEVSNFLSRHGVEGYKEYDLHQAIQSNQDCVVNLGQGSGIEFSEYVDTAISLDKMKVTCKFTPPSQNGNLLTRQDIIAELTTRGIKFGICEENIDDFLSNHTYNTEYVFAQGKAPRHGKDASIEYFFNTNPSLKPKHNEDGSVDYHDLNTICPVEKGQKLATLHPMDPGEPGQDVFGKVIPPRSVKNRKLEYGLNISLSEDGNDLISDVTGHVTLQGGKVFVSDVYEVPADVDASTGDINYAGSVHIRGSVRGGFTVIAENNIIVEGSVEDALLQAGGDIIVRHGIQGMQRGVMEAKGNVITKYIENAKVFAGGYVETGSIIYSEVGAGEDVIVAEHKGFVNGGVIRAGGKVSANSIGSTMGSKTIVEVGMSPEKKERYNVLQKDLEQSEAELEKIQPIIAKYKQLIMAGTKLDPKNRMYFNQLMEHMRELNDQMAEDKEEFEKLHQEMVAGKHAKVTVRKDIYPGTVISISDTTCVVKDKRSYCCIERKNGEIVFSNL